MSRLTFAFLLLSASCSPTEQQAPEPLLIGDFPEQAPLADCRQVRAPLEETPTIVRSVADSAFLVDFGIARISMLLDHDLRVMAKVRYQSDGPVGVRDVRDLALVDDTVLLYADRPNRRLKRISVGQRDMGTVELPFPPEAIVPLGAGLLISHTVFSRREEVLMSILGAGGSLEPIVSPPVRLPDPQLETLANLVILLPLARGRAVAIHQFLSPMGRLISLEQKPTEVRLLPLPIPEGVADRIGWFPGRPFRDGEILKILTPALDADVDRGKDEVLVLTRSGERQGDSTEKAVLRLSAELDFLSAVRLPVNAGHLVSLASHGEVLVVDGLDRWFRCDAP